jgi:hypothetical protein
MKKSVAIIQSNYLPWKGYFDIIHDVDEFIFYDDVQYTKNDWRNRNLIKTPRGAEWLTVPAGGDLHRLICEVSLHDTAWQAKHWRLLELHYSTAPWFGDYRGFLEEFYLHGRWNNLSILNQHLIKRISCDFLGIKTQFSESHDYDPQGSRLDRLLDILKKSGATTYVSGPAAKDYIVPAQFDAAGIELVWKDYSDYPEYPQFNPPFTHKVTILDLLLQVGANAPRYIWGHRSIPESVTESYPANSDLATGARTP